MTLEPDNVCHEQTATAVPRALRMHETVQQCGVYSAICGVYTQHSNARLIPRDLCMPCHHHPLMPEASEYAQCFMHTRCNNINCLEASLQPGILLYKPAVLVLTGAANNSHFTPGQQKRNSSIVSQMPICCSPHVSLGMLFTAHNAPIMYPAKYHVGKGYLVSDNNCGTPCPEAAAARNFLPGQQWFQQH